jgi:glutathione-independent formaldehyde dehydrogenase
VTMNCLVASTKATGGIGVVGVFVPQDPGATTELAKQGKMPFDFGSFWFKGQAIRTGQANVKAYNRQLARLISQDKAHPGQIISHRLALADAPEGYRHFDDRSEGWTKVILKP